MTVRLAVLLSGSGRTLQNIIDVIARGELDAKIDLVLSSRSDAGGIERARSHGLPVEIVPRRQFPSPDLFSAAIDDVLRRRPVDLVLLAGFLSLWKIPESYRGRVLNIHPALLPRFGGPGFYGHRVHEEVLKAGARESGCTVHVADNEYDHGPVILQRTVPVLPDDTPGSLADRVFREECIAYPEAIRMYVREKLSNRKDVQ